MLLFGRRVRHYKFITTASNNWLKRFFVIIRPTCLLAYIISTVKELMSFYLFMTFWLFAWNLYLDWVILSVTWWYVKIVHLLIVLHHLSLMCTFVIIINHSKKFKYYHLIETSNFIPTIYIPWQHWLFVITSFYLLLLLLFSMETESSLC